MAANSDVVFGEETEVDWGGSLRKVIYIEVIDADLFRLGKKAATKIDKLRFAEDDRRTSVDKPKKNDIATYKAGESVKVRAKSGGISVYDGISKHLRMGKSDQWWCIPEGTKIPAGLRVAKDATAGKDEETVVVQLLYACLIVLFF